MPIAGPIAIKGVPAILLAAPNAVVKGAIFNAELARMPAPVIAAEAGFDDLRFVVAFPPRPDGAVNAAAMFGAGSVTAGARYAG
tara:strand:- start:189 stop:440 length:252 start_codon:yes stop_codon:yes gene_type:complete